MAAETYIRSSPEYRAAREAALYDLNYRGGYFEVALPIEDALGRNLLAEVEGVVRVAARSGAEPLAAMNFDGGPVIARFKVAADGEPLLVTMLPVGRRQ